MIKNNVIIKGIGGFYYVNTEQGLAECRARGKLRKLNITPAVGDIVEVKIANLNPLEGAIEKIMPRKNALVRPPVANVDAIVVVIAAASPAPDLFMVDKLIVTAEKNNIEVIITVNKTDLKNADEIVNIYSKIGYKVISTCAIQDIGIDELLCSIQGKTTAFAGNSGVGKSSIINSLGFELETGEVSRIDRGKHTTRHAELLPLVNGGYVIDTPGFSLLEITEISANELDRCFIEFMQYKDMCNFKDCTHFGVKSNTCAVIDAVKKGYISESRYHSYELLYDTLKDVKEWE